MPTVSCQKLQTFAVHLLAAGGASREEAELVGASLVDANLRGYDSHGVMRIPFYLDMLAKGEIVSGAPLTMLNETPGGIVADAGWGFGRVQAGMLLRRCQDKARQNGTAVGTLRNCSHVGRLGEYCEIAAGENLVSMMMVNTHGAARRVAPPGGIAPRLGTNPLAIGVPDGQQPLILDFSTSATAEGKVRVKKIAGQPCPDGWLLDAQGKPTTDPNCLYADPPGTILPMGGAQSYKGFGLALMIDIFCGALSGGLCSRETPLTPKGNAVFLMLLDPEHFAGQKHFTEEVRQLVDFVRHCPRAGGVDEITLPGDPERAACQRHLSEGINLDDENWRQLIQLGEKLNIAAP